MRFLGVLAISVLAILASGSTVTLAQTAATAPAIRSFDVPTTEALGRELYRQDRAAWLATDAVLARLKDPSKAKVVGWIVPPAQGDGDLVRFLQDGGSSPQVAYDVRISKAGGATVSEPSDPSLSAEERANWAARKTAIANVGPACRAGYNTAVAHDPVGGDWLVWLLAPMPAKGQIPVGGHYRFTVSPDGQTLKQRDALFASCLTVDPGQGLPQGATPVAAVMSSVVSPTPNETHVFLELQAGLPFYVMTPSSKKMWVVDHGRISEGKLPSR